jgi:hypothetical protein
MKSKHFLVVLFLVLAIFLSGCLEAKILSDDIVIEDWHQNYNEYFGEWSDFVQVWFKIFNTGNTEISQYTIWFTAYCEGGSSYEDWANGLYVEVGHYNFGTCFIDLGKNKKVISVKATDWKLEHWNYPNQ